MTGEGGGYLLVCRTMMGEQEEEGRWMIVFLNGGG